EEGLDAPTPCLEFESEVRILDLVADMGDLVKAFSASGMGTISPSPMMLSSSLSFARSSPSMARKAPPSAPSSLATSAANSAPSSVSASPMLARDR
ncbi:hypothetical protein EMIHUDRAFT_370366, partial [Emiliania huxleyi CCMP1516]|uniref:Uncharacterized protein n=2 Tax=Emiliania huxleyi TaxID=2903 RepID=A0A0D3IYY4_EMIH1